MLRYFWIDEREIECSLPEDDPRHPFRWSEPIYHVVDSTGKKWFVSQDGILAERIAEALDGMVYVRDANRYLSDYPLYVREAEDLLDNFEPYSFQGKRTMGKGVREYIEKSREMMELLNEKAEAWNTESEIREITLTRQQALELLDLVDYIEYLANFGEVDGLEFGNI